MFEKILIANRGEIAVRVIRACWDLDIWTVAVYSDADRTAPHVRLAREAVRLGPPPSTESYLRIDRVIEAAKQTGAQAIHPGYGFLAENAEFAEACEAEGLVFIGPPASAIRDMGNKVVARRMMMQAGVPVVPGSEPLEGDGPEVLKAAEEVGYPIMIKAAAGGGGKGMRIVREPGELVSSLERARSESGKAFGDPTVYLEHLVERPRHIEVQILFDRQGNGVHFGERECSIQRRHQKLIEEAPSPVVDEETRQRIGEMALDAGRAAGYVNAGTVELLRGDDGSFYFMEMNTRLQVEHPVTEMVYGVDLAQAQIRIAGGEPLPFRQEDIHAHGHAIECRIYAEDPDKGFLPSPGRIDSLRIPSGPGIRDDGAAYPGYEIPLEYDPLVAKLVAHGADREQAILRMYRALDEYRLDGIRTAIPFHRKVMRHPAFRAGELTTGFIEEHKADLGPESDPWLDEVALLAAAVHAHRSKAKRSRAGEDGAPEEGSRWKDAGRRRALGRTP
jgi:acetyl-CoA carboxylase biotin carboxylase subunit